MPFELCFDKANSKILISPQARIYRAIAIWLFLCGFMVMLMVLIGGITRLTGSGLSIVEWKPVTGIIYPLTNGDWQVEFAKYKYSPEYNQINHGMSISEFKFIFSLEYIHRLLGRITGLIFLGPLIYFAAKKSISSSLAYKLLAIFTLGAIEGGVGWYMVSSGLKTTPEVSQYRLALHLIFACLIFSSIIWLACSHLRKATTHANLNLPNYPRAIFNHAIFNLILIFLQIAIGAFVAGLKAGLIYNSFPLMDGQFIPNGVLMLQPFWKNIFENVATVQFIHRLLAYAILASVICFVYRNRSLNLSKDFKLLINLLLYIVIGQFCLGVFTLLYKLPITLASMHQIGAIILLAVATSICNYLHHSFNNRNFSYK